MLAAEACSTFPRAPFEQPIEGFSNFLPTVKAAPPYPAQALASSLEGYVITEFAIDTNGITYDPVVIESSLPVFEAPTLASILRYRYKPCVVEGEPVAMRGIRNTIVFRMNGYSVPLTDIPDSARTHEMVIVPPGGPDANP